MSGGQDKQVIVWKTNFDCDGKKERKAPKKHNKTRMNIIEESFMTDINAKLKTPGE